MFDYIVVGGGTSGCALAAELSADPSVTVLLLEAGGPGRGPLFRIPKASMFVTERSPRYAYLYDTEPFGPAGRTESWTRGRVLGGTSAINGMIYNRGGRQDWDAIPGWGWDDILPVFRALEDHQLGATEQRGAGGPLHISVHSDGEPVAEAFIEAAGAQGLDRTADVNAGDGERIGYTPATIRRGVRQSANEAFLRPARSRPNLVVRTGAAVSRVVIRAGRAVGVLVGRGDHAEEIRASREVVLASGGIETPKLLELSGIGDAGLLRGLGIDVVADRPAVGANVIEQYIVQVSVRFNRPGLGHNRALQTASGVLSTLSSYAFRRTGLLAGPGAEVLGLLRTDRAEPDVDAQVWMTALNADSDNRRLERDPGAMILGQVTRPGSRGHQHIVSPDSAVPPRIDFRPLSTPDDRRRTVALLRRMRDIVAEQPFAGLVDAETRPGPAVQDDEELLDYALRRGFSAYHAIGGCAMGTAPEAVTDIDLRVRGVEALRVIDASVLPAFVSGNPAAGLMAMAVLAARRILADR